MKTGATEKVVPAASYPIDMLSCSCNGHTKEAKKLRYLAAEMLDDI